VCPLYYHLLVTLFLSIVRAKVIKEKEHNDGLCSLWACSLVGVGAGLGWLVLVFYERKTLLAGWFGLAETNKRTGYLAFYRSKRALTYYHYKNLLPSIIQSKHLTLGPLAFLCGLPKHARKHFIFCPLLVEN